MTLNIDCVIDIFSYELFFTVLRFLDAIVQENFIIRRQDYNTAFNAAVSGNEHNTQIAFQYIQENLALVTRA